MLRGIDARIDADLLHALRAMGHGDCIALVDINFPSRSMAASTVVGRPLSLPVGLAEGVSLITALMPLDHMAPDYAQRMEVVGDPGAEPPAISEVAQALGQAGETRPILAIERFAFYELTRRAYAIVQTLENRPYGNVVLTKGVLFPDV